MKTSAILFYSWAVAVWAAPHATEHSNHNVAIRNEDAVEDYLIAIIKRAKEDGLVKRETDTSVEDYLIAIIKRAQDDSLIKRDAADAVEDYLIAII